MPESDSHVPLNKLFDLTGKGAVVTGGAQGIGLGIACRLAEAGAGVLIADVQKEGAEKAVKELVSYGFKVARVQCDVTDCDQVQAAIQAAVSTFGNVSILVNNTALSSLVQTGE